MPHSGKACEKMWTINMSTINIIPLTAAAGSICCDGTFSAALASYQINDFT